MREIKFRAWDLDQKKIFKIKHIQWVPRIRKPMVVQYVGQGETKYRRNFELMQYTGLKDKKGMDIYEGDVVQINPEWVNGWSENRNGGIGRITLGNGSFGIAFRETNIPDLRIPGRKHIEVIGNIYSNPELLKG